MVLWEYYENKRTKEFHPYTSPTHSPHPKEKKMNPLDCMFICLIACMHILFLIWLTSFFCLN